MAEAKRVDWLVSQKRFYKERIRDSSGDGSIIYERSPYQEAITEIWIDFVGRFIPPEANILDAGCGEGRITRAMVPKTTGQIIAIDLSPELIAEANRLTPPGLLESGRIVYMSCAIENISHAPRICNSKFDIVLMTDVIEHLYNPRESLGILRGVMAEDSTLLVQTCNGRRLRNRLWGFLGQSRVSKAHFEEYTQEELTNILQSSGFEIQALVGIGFIPGMGRFGTPGSMLTRLTQIDLELGKRFSQFAGGFMVACVKSA